MEIQSQCQVANPAQIAQCSSLIPRIPIQIWHLILLTVMLFLAAAMAEGMPLSVHCLSALPDASGAICRSVHGLRINLILVPTPQFLCYFDSSHLFTHGQTNSVDSGYRREQDCYLKGVHLDLATSFALQPHDGLASTTNDESHHLGRREPVQQCCTAQAIVKGQFVFFFE